MSASTDTKRPPTGKSHCPLAHARYRSGIDLKTYQLQPLVRSLEMSFALMLIVASAGRVEKWQVEMRVRFGVEFRVLDTADQREVARTRGPHVDPLKSTRGWSRPSIG